MSGLFGGGASNSMKPEIYTGMQVTTSLLGASIPYVAGRTRCKMNLLWYGNWVVSTSNSGGGKGGGGGGTKQYSYSAAFIAGLCIGPIQGTFRIWHDRSLIDLGSQAANLAYENLALALGSSGQAVWSGFPSGTPTVQKIPYDHISYVASSAYNFGASAAMPQFTFEVEGVVPGYSDANSVFDADPSAVIPDYLLDSVHGALGNYPGTTLTIGSSDAPLTGATNSYQAYVMSMNLLTSPYEDTQRQSTDFLAEILDCTNSNVWLSCDTLKVIPYCDSAVSGTVAGTAFSYTPNLTPLYIFGDDDYCPQDGEPPVKLNRKPQSDSFNMLNVEYLDRSNYYNSASVPSSDLNDIAKYGPRLAPSKSWHQITQAQVARTAGQLWLQRQLYERNSYTIRVRRNYALAEGMDYIALNSSDPNLLLSGQLCQITEVETEDDDKGSHLVITAREIPGVTRTTAQYNWAGAQGYFANYAADPGAVQAPIIFTMPTIAAAMTAGINVGVAVCGQTANATWLGCDVFCSVDGGTTYQYVGTVPEACRYGTLTANLSAVADPDTTSTLAIALANTNLQLSTAVTHAEADSAQTLILLRGASSTTGEVMAYGTAALTSAGHYNLTYLRRGLYGSTDQAYSSGNTFVRLDGAIFQMSFDPGMSGQTVYFKFVSFNQYTRYGQQTLAGAVAYSYVLPGGMVVNAFGGVGQLKAVGSGALDANGNFYKSTAAGNAWDSAAVTQQTFTTCSISAAFAHAGTPGANFAAVGLTAVQTNIDPHAASTFSWYQDNGTWYVMEGGTFGTTGGGVSVGDMAMVTYDGYVVRYFLNGNLIQTTGFPGASFYEYVSCYDPGSSFSSVTVGPYLIVTPSQFITNQPNIVSISDTKISKPNGSAGWNVGALSEFSYYTMHFAAKTNNVNTSAPLGRCMFGLCTPAHASAVINGDYTSLDYAWYSNEIQWQIYENGTLISTPSSAASLTDIAWITCDGTNVRYYLNDPTTAVRTIAVSTTPLFGGVTLYDAGALNAGLNSIAFGPGTSLQLHDSSQINNNAVTDVVTSTGSASLVHTGWTTASSVTVGPYPWPTNVVVTATCQLTQEYTGSAGGTVFLFSATALLDSVSGLRQCNINTQGDVPGVNTDEIINSVTAEYTWSLAAGTTATYSWQGEQGTPTQLTATMGSAIIKAEVIKR